MQCTGQGAALQSPIVRCARRATASNKYTAAPAAATAAAVAAAVQLDAAPGWLSAPHPPCPLHAPTVTHMVKQPWHLTSMKYELGEATRRCCLCLRFSSSAGGLSRSMSHASTCTAASPGACQCLCCTLPVGRRPGLPALFGGFNPHDRPPRPLAVPSARQEPPDAITRPLGTPCGAPGPPGVGGEAPSLAGRAMCHAALLARPSPPRARPTAFRLHLASLGATCSTATWLRPARAAQGTHHGGLRILSAGRCKEAERGVKRGLEGEVAPSPVPGKCPPR